MHRPPSTRPASIDPYLGFSWKEVLWIAILLVGVHLTSTYNYLLFHTASELFSIFIAATIGIIVINCWQSIRNQYILFVGVAYFFIGLLDVLHTLSYKGMPIFTDYDYYAPQFWIAARYLESISMLLGFAFLGTQRKVRIPLAMAGFSLVTAALVSSILYFKNFPVCFVAGKGLTPFKVYSEYIICTLMLGNLALLYWRKEHFDRRVYRLIAWSAVFMIAMELCFTLYVTDAMSDAFNQAGHLFKIATYYLIYKAVVVTALRDPLNLLFRELQEHEAELESRVVERTSKLAESENRFRSMADSAPALIWVAGLDRQWFWFNKRWLEFTGRPLVQEVGSGWTDGIHADDLERCLNTYGSAFDAQREFSIECRLRRHDGQYRWLIVNGVPRFDDHGHFAGYIGSCIDITERKIADADRNRLLKIIEQAPEFIALSDMQFRLLYLNQAGARLIGLAESVEASSITIHDLHPAWAGRRMHEEALAAALAHGLWQGESALLHQNGSEIAVTQLLLVHRDESGAPAYLSTIMRDISQQKANEASLTRARIAAEAANLAKSRFLATMSHEIRTPMNGILGMAQLLLMPAIHDHERVEYARTILASGQTLLTLLNDILDLSKIEAGKFQLEDSEVDPQALLQEIHRLFAGTASAKGLEFHHTWAGPSAPRYRTDGHRLRQMLSNLIGNAIKFTARGQVQMEGRECERGDGTATLEFSVHDSGIGIADDKLALLFKPFSQVDSSTTRNYGGSGLGLSIVYNLAKAMGGDVGVESTVGAGSRFWFRIQVRVASRPQHSPSPAGTVSNDARAFPADAPLQGCVLVAEDNSINRMVIDSLLKSLGLTVLLTNNGQEVVDAYQRSPLAGGPCQANMILMDVHMPNLDGYQATRHIRQWEATHKLPRIPIIALTADAFEEDRQHCLAAGMDDYLTKPVAVDALRTTLAKWLPSRGTESDAPAEPVAEMAALDRDALAQFMGEIAPLLAANKFDAIRCYRSLEQLAAGSTAQAEVAAIGILVRELKFEQALQQLRSLAEAVGAAGGSERAPGGTPGVQER